jgi:aminopeptidase N
MSLSQTLRLLLPLLLALATPAAWAVAAPPAAQLALEITLDPATRQLAVIATVSPGEENFRFALHESLHIASASVDGQPIALRRAGKQGDLRAWAARLPTADATLRIEYQGTLPALDARLDHRQVLHGMPPMAAVEGSFLPSGSGWYPQPAALFTYRVRLSVPGDQRALVAGHLFDEQLPVSAGDRYRAGFEFAHPADGIDLMAGPWIVREKMMPTDGAAPLRLRTYFTRELEEVAGLADAYLDDTVAYIARYGREIGAYPFSGFSVVASPLPTGFGMPTLTYLGAEVLKLPFIRATSLGHEILHNWWGNGVYVAYARGNWAEGLTTFMADYAYKESESAAAARAMRLGWLRDFAALPAASRQTLASFRSRTHGAAAAVGYGKAAMLFVMLRDLVGEQSFRAGLQLFWQQQRFRIAGWDDLQRAFEQASGKSLTLFFRQWLERDGAPELKIKSASISTIAGDTRLTLEVTQNSPAYALRVPIEVNDGQRSQSRAIDIEHLQQAVSLTVDGSPQSVVLDPQLRLWRLLDATQLPPILRQWIVAREPRLLQVSSLPELRAAATAVAARVFEVAPREIPPGALRNSSTPVLLVGLHAEVDAALAAAGLPPRPPTPGQRGSAQVWTIAGHAEVPVAVVSARDAAALRALLRPLPHYGSQSWLVFDGSRALARGVWPIVDEAVPVSRLPAGTAGRKAGG